MKKLLFLILIFCCGYFFPKVASTSFGKQTLEQHFSKKLRAEVQISDLSLNWFGTQKCGAITITGTNSLQTTIDSVESPSSLFRLFSPKSRSVHLEGGKILLENPKGLRKILSVLKKKKEKKRDFAITFSQLDIEIEKGVVRLEKTPLFLDGSIEIILSGTIDSKSQEADLILGIPAKSIKKLVGLKELPADFVLEVPLSGKLDSLLNKITSDILIQFLGIY